jgi:YD repeat-containing protein
LATGNTYIEQFDVTLPGLGGGLPLTRRWNSTPATAGYGMFGHQWISNFEEQVSVGSDNMIKYLRGDGSLWTFGFASDWGPTGYTPTFWTAAPFNGAATLAYYGTYIQGVSMPYWLLTLKNGETRVYTGTNANSGYNQVFYLSSITDRNGNAVTLTYDAATHRLTTVTDAASRHLYFSYQTMLVGGVSVSVVSGVTSDFGVSLSYQYDSSANLTQVTKPDNTYVTLQYNPAGLLTAVIDQSGKTLESHTYDISGRGLTSSRAAGVDSVTVSY